MAKLVNEPNDAEPLLEKVYDDLKIAAETVSNPECRSVCERAMIQLNKCKREISENPRKVLFTETELPKVIAALGSPSESETVAATYVTEIMTSLANCRAFEEDVWASAFKDVLGFFNDAAKVSALAEQFRAECEANTEPEPEIDLDEDVENLCDCTFSLAYGSKILLNNTHLKLKRGFKYGLMGANQCGKTTLLQAIANEQVEGFPPPTEVKTMFMATDIHADDSDMTVIEYIKAEKHPSWGGGPGSNSRRRDCHSAGPPSPFSRRFNRAAEGASAK